MVLCRECGAEVNDESAIYCPECGNKMQGNSQTFEPKRGLMELFMGGLAGFFSVGFFNHNSGYCSFICNRWFGINSITHNSFCYCLCPLYG